jgi:hypothetical protein
MNAIIKALFIGLIFGIIDAILIINMDPNWNYYHIATAITFWSIASLVVRTTNLGGEVGIKKGIIWAFILNIPWAFNFAGMGMVELLAPLTVLSLVFGTGIGFLNKRFNN